MKKSDLLKMDRLAATPNMMRLAQNDKPVIVVAPYSRSKYEKYKHDLYIRCRIQNGILKVGRLTDFQAHQIEHQLGAYTDCNHGQGLAVIHPAYYRHIMNDAKEKFTRFARVVFGKESAEEGIEALAAFIEECGLPTKLSQLRSTTEITPELLRKVADSTNIINSNPRALDADETYDILMECR